MAVPGRRERVTSRPAPGDIERDRWNDAQSWGRTVAVRRISGLGATSAGILEREHPPDGFRDSLLHRIGKAAANSFGCGKIDPGFGQYVSKTKGIERIVPETETIQNVSCSCRQSGKPFRQGWNPPRAEFSLKSIYPMPKRYGLVVRKVKDPFVNPLCRRLEELPVLMRYVAYVAV